MTRSCIIILIGAVLQAAEPGLVGTWSDQRHTVRVVVGSPNFSLSAADSIHPTLVPAFNAEWAGSILITQAGDYSFTAGSAAVTIDGRAATRARLSAGPHPIRIRYARQSGPATLELRWQSNHFPEEPVPPSVMFCDPPPELDRQIEQGRLLVEDLGCANCHRATSTSLVARTGPNLTGIGTRVKHPWIYRWLSAPQSWRASAVMPDVLANDQERADVAAYLASLTGAALSAPARNPRIARGNELFGSIGCVTCHRLDAIPLDGLGSKMSVPALAAFLKEPSRIEPTGRMPSMLLSDDEALAIAAYLADARKPAFEAKPVDGDAVRGKRLATERRCAACHAPEDATLPQATALDQVNVNRGCLADQPAGLAPRYRLTAATRTALRAFITSYKAHADQSSAPVYDSSRRLKQLGCVTCHQVDGAQPLATLAEAVPALTGVGAKLRTAWIDRVLSGRQRVHPSLAIRMPHYEPQQVAGLAASLARSAGVEPGDGTPQGTISSALEKRGHGLLGTNPKTGGMGCIGCHDWGENRSLGEEGPQLINAAERLRYDWYRRWMRNPARILSGTSMPNYFGTMNPERAGEMIDSLWAALSAGSKLPVPDGFRAVISSDAETKPKPGKEAVIVRWDMPESTPAAIAVGLPEGLSYCFDAGECRLRYAWQGGFLDMTDTLLRKTEKNRLTPTAKLIGTIFWRSESFPIRVGDPERVPQHKFRGYRIVDGRPQFQYQVDGIDVVERIVAGSDGSELIRDFTISRVDQPMWFVDGSKREIPRGALARFRITHASRKAAP